MPVRGRGPLPFCLRVGNGRRRQGFSPVLAPCRVRPLAAGLLSVKAPCQGERRSTTLICNSQIKRRFLPRAGFGAPRLSPYSPKAWFFWNGLGRRCGAWSSLSHGKISEDHVVDLRRSAFPFDMEPCAERSPVEARFRRHEAVRREEPSAPRRIADACSRRMTPIVSARAAWSQ